jgi:hypothetical protein
MPCKLIAFRRNQFVTVIEMKGAHHHGIYRLDGRYQKIQTVSTAREAGIAGFLPKDR